MTAAVRRGSAGHALAILSAFLLSSCAVCDRHPTACRTLAASAVLETALLARSRGAAGPPAQTSTVNCPPRTSELQGTVLCHQ